MKKLINYNIMNRIDKMIEINTRKYLSQIAECYSIIKEQVYNGNGKKAYLSLKPISKQN